MGEAFLPSVLLALLALAFLAVAFLGVMPLSLLLGFFERPNPLFFERPNPLISLSFLGAMVLCGWSGWCGAGRWCGGREGWGEVAGREGRRGARYAKYSHGSLLTG